MMKQVKISSLHYEMLVALSKKLRLKPELLLEQLIEIKYNAK